MIPRAATGTAFEGSAVPSVGEKTPPFHVRPVALPLSLASSALNMCVVTPAVLAKSRHFAQPASSFSSCERIKKPATAKPPCLRRSRVPLSPRDRGSSLPSAARAHPGFAGGTIPNCGWNCSAATRPFSSKADLDAAARQIICREHARHAAADDDDVRLARQG